MKISFDDLRAQITRQFNNLCGTVEAVSGHMEDEHVNQLANDVDDLRQFLVMLNACELESEQPNDCHDLSEKLKLDKLV